MKGVEKAKLYSVIYRVFVQVNLNNPILLNAFLYTFKQCVEKRVTSDSKYIELIKRAEEGMREQGEVLMMEGQLHSYLLAYSRLF
jgi:hypothetical protein